MSTLTYKKYTPENITALEQKEIFIFGSNSEGQHYGGAARVAHDMFFAEWGVGRGLTGLCYALPTLYHPTTTSEPGAMLKLSLEELDLEFEYLFDCINRHPDYTFYLTKVGCGIAGFSIEEIKEIFKKHYKEEKNLIYPIEFD
jgi:hypothetical protein